MPKFPPLQQLAFGNRRFFTQICLCAANRYRIEAQVVNKNATLARRQAAGNAAIFLLNLERAGESG
jgi:hypothetical protein